MSWKDIDVTSSKPWRGNSFGPTGKSDQTYRPQCLCIPSPLRVWALFSHSAVKLPLHVRERATNRLRASHLIASTPRGNGFIRFFVARLKPWGKALNVPCRAIPVSRDLPRRQSPWLAWIQSDAHTWSDNMAAFSHATSFILREEYFPEDVSSQKKRRVLASQTSSWIHTPLGYTWPLIHIFSFLFVSHKTLWRVYSIYNCFHFPDGKNEVQVVGATQTRS